MLNQPFWILETWVQIPIHRPQKSSHIKFDKNPSSFVIFVRHVGFAILNFGNLRSDWGSTTLNNLSYQVSENKNQNCIICFLLTVHTSVCNTTGQFWFYRWVSNTEGIKEDQKYKEISLLKQSFCRFIY